MLTKKAVKIIKTTIKLFLKEGVGRSTMDDIAAYCNVSKVTIYKYFSDKDTLYFEVGKAILSDSLEDFKKIETSKGPLKKKLYEFLAAVTEFKDTGKWDLCLEISKYNNDFSDEYESYLKTYRELMLKLIDMGLSEGLIKKGLDREYIYHYINMGVIYYQNAPEYRNLMRNNSRFQQAFMTFFVNNIFIESSQILSEK
jgi:AcrR family transcriptional regulator